MSNSEISPGECPNCSADLDGHASCCPDCWAKSSGYRWLLSTSITLAWVFTLVFGLFLALGTMAALKNVKQDYGFMYYTALLFALSLCLARWLPRLRRR